MRSTLVHITQPAHGGPSLAPCGARTCGRPAFPDRGSSRRLSVMRYPTREYQSDLPSRIGCVCGQGRALSIGLPKLNASVNPFGVYVLRMTATSSFGGVLGRGPARAGPQRGPPATPHRSHRWRSRSWCEVGAVDNQLHIGARHPKVNCAPGTSRVFGLAASKATHHRTPVSAGGRAARKVPNSRASSRLFSRARCGAPHGALKAAVGRPNFQLGGDQFDPALCPKRQRALAACGTGAVEGDGAARFVVGAISPQSASHGSF